MPDIINSILKDLPDVIASASFEGANIVLYTGDKDFFLNSEEKIKAIVNKIKKRIELRADESLFLEKEKTEKFIREVVPKEAEVTEIIFDVQRSIVIIEAKKPGMAIGKGGEILREIRKKTFWLPQVQRSPAIRSQITENIRNVLYLNNNYRKRFLNSIGKAIYKEWNPEKIDEWIRLTFLGSGRQVGRSCLLLHTPESKILLDCGIDVAAQNKEKFPYLDASECNIKEIDAIIISHAHLDHCLPPETPVLTTNGTYKGIDEIQVGDNILSLNWQTGRYQSAKCISKTKTTGHKIIQVIHSPYSTIESSPNHRFFTVENLEIKEIEASQLKEGMLLPSNILNKPQIITEPKIELDVNIIYDTRRKDSCNLPSKLTPELAQFLGYFFGDGHKSSEFSLRITDSSFSNLENYRKILKQVFNQDAKIRHHSDKTKNAYVLEINNVKILRFFEKNFPGIFKDSSHVEIPEKIMSADTESKKAFIRGVADADGTVTGRVKISSYSNRLLFQLHHILSSLGVPATLSVKDHSVCMSSIYSINTFQEKINFSDIDKRSRLQLLAKKGDFQKEDLVPITSEDILKILKQAGFFGRVHGSPNIDNLPSAILDLYRRKKGYANRETALKIVNLLENRIEEMRSLKSRVYNELYNVRQGISLTRQEITLNTGLKYDQIQAVENNLVKGSMHTIICNFVMDKINELVSLTLTNIQKIKLLLNLEVTWERIKKIELVENPYPYLVDIEVAPNRNFISGNFIVHNSGMVPWLYKMGYRGPCYMTLPTRDISSLLALDYIGVAYKKAEQPLFSSDDIKEMVKHSICLEYNEVTDITPDVRLTFYNAGHALGSSMIHLNIGNGLHNMLYTADMKFGKTRLLEPAETVFPRLETVIVESTYGSKNDILPSRKDAEDMLINAIKKTIERKGKVLIPELGLGRSQETMLILEQAMKSGMLEKIPIYIDGMIWDVTAIHTAYPNFLSNVVKSQVFQDNNPFASDIFKRIGSPQERQEVVEGGPCVVLATSGMLVGGASVEYFREFAGSKNNSIIFVCYQGIGSLGRQVQEGIKEVKFQVENREEIAKVNMEVITIDGLTAHSGRNQLLAFVNNLQPQPKRIIINHGEQSKCLDLASTLYQLYRVETSAPRNLETIRLR